MGAILSKKTFCIYISFSNYIIYVTFYIFISECGVPQKKEPQEKFCSEATV